MTNHPNRLRGPYVIIVTRSWYGPSETKSLEMDDTGQKAMQFSSRHAAIAYIDHVDSGRYYLAHNESSRAEYAVKAIKSLPTYLAREV